VVVKQITELSGLFLSLFILPEDIEKISFVIK